jgi:superfamily I DNA/RNA helicase
MTLHRAKGLEFDAVAIVHRPTKSERERMLMYVGLSRAKREALQVRLAG